MKSYIYIIAFPVLLSVGCSSINQPIASIDLVQNETNQSNIQQIDQELVNLLSQDNDELTTKFRGDLVSIQALFFSATGDKCRYVIHDNTKNLYCSNEEELWRLITPVLAEINFDS